MSPDERRAYMREYMRKRRASFKNREVTPSIETELTPSYETSDSDVSEVS